MADAFANPLTCKVGHILVCCDAEVDLALCLCLARAALAFGQTWGLCDSAIVAHTHTVTDFAENAKHRLASLELLAESTGAKSGLEAIPASKHAKYGSCKCLTGTLASPTGCFDF